MSSSDTTFARHAPGAGVAGSSYSSICAEARVKMHAGDWTQARKLWQAAYKQSPKEVEVLGNLALIAKHQGDLQESLKYWRAALKVSPKNAGLLSNLADVCRLLHYMEEAEQAIRKALQISPERHEIRAGLATLLWDARRIEEALEECAKIPEGAEVRGAIDNLRGNILSHLGDGRGARKAFTAALENKPDNALYHSNQLLSLLYDETLSAEEVAQAHRKFGVVYDRPRARHIRNSDPCRPLRVAMLSSDFRLHSVAYFVEPLAEALNRKQFELILYSNVSRPDDMTAALKAHAYKFVMVNGYSEGQFIQQCEDDEVDILIELNGHTGGNLLPLLGKRAAPVQISWLGYPHSTGMSTIDYRLSDEVIEPMESSQPLSTEKIWHIPEGCHLYRLPGKPVEIGALPLLEKSYPTFISCNNSAKISPTTLHLWARLLGEVPEAKLILKNSGFTYLPRQREVLEFFASMGVASERIEFHQLKKSVHQHLMLYHEADIALDTYPYNGTTTTCEALWMGLPVITLSGESACSRHTESLLRQVGLSDWIAKTEDGYIARLKEAVSDPNGLSDLRAGLRRRLQLSPLGHPVHFAGRFQGAMRRIWAQTCLGQGASELSVQSAFKQAGNDELLGEAALSVSRAQAEESDGKILEAAELWERAAHTGRLPDAWIQAASRWTRLGEKKRLVELWRAGVQLHPERADFWATLAEMEVDGRDDHKAVAAYEKAVKLSPKNPGVWMNMSAALRRLNLTIRAEVAVRKAIELKPDFAEAWNNLGGILRDQAKFDEAVGAYCTALNHRPDDVITHSNLVYLLNFVPGMSHEELREQFAVFNQTHFGNLVAADLQLVESDRDAPLRLGLLSSDLRCHSVGYFLRAALPALSAAGAELHVYADVSSPDELSHELRTSVHSWHWVSHQSDTDLANQIRSDALDVLLELNGHTAGNRLAMLATRVAPWQGSWLGFPASPECQGIDFFVSDEVVYPERGSDNSLILRVKGGAFPYAIPAQLPEVECSLHDSPLVFGAFHSFPKLNEHVWKDWIRLLNRFPNSRLKVKSKQLTESAALDQLLVKLKELEAPLERIDFLSYTDTVAAHLSCYREIDIALDPSPYNGVTTTMEALSMGVPVLTIPGETPASRHAASLLQSFVKGVGVCSGFEDMVAYIEKAESNLSEFRAKRIARHRDFVRRLDEHASQWAHEFINTITDQTKERKCQPQKN